MPNVDCDQLWEKIKDLQEKIDKLLQGPYKELLAEFEKLLQMYENVKAEQDAVGRYLQRGSDIYDRLFNRGFETVDDARERLQELEEQLEPLWEQAEELPEQLEDLDEELEILREILELCGQSEMFDGGVNPIDSIIEDSNFGSDNGESPEILNEIESCDDVQPLINAKEGEYSNLNAQLNEVGGQINQLEPEYYDISGLIDELEDLEGEIKDVLPDFSLEDAVQLLNDELDRLIAELATLRDKMGELSKNDVVQEYDALTDQLNKLREQYRTNCAKESENE